MTTPRGPRYKQIPLWRDASRFLLEVERAVRQFPRYHKDTLGSELRRQAMNVCPRRDGVFTPSHTFTVFNSITIDVFNPCLRAVSLST